MNRQEFMRRLEELLKRIPASEREEALQYYNDYFDDAGPENEANVIRELGSPEQVAQKIAPEQFKEKIEPEQTGLGQPAPVVVKKTGGGWKVLAIILLCILLAPIIIPLGIAVLAVLVSVIVAVVAVCFGIVVAGVAILVAGIVVIGTGLVKLFVTPAVGLAVSGVGLLLFALGILLSLAIFWCCLKVVPWLIRGIVKLIRWPFRKAGVVS